MTREPGRMTHEELPVVPGWEAAAVEPPAVTQVSGGVATQRRTQVIGDASVAMPSLEQIEQGRQAAYDEGFVAGRATGFEDAVRRGSELQAAFLSAVEETSSRLDGERRDLLTAVVDLSVDVATAIMDRTPHDEGAALVARIRELSDSSSQTVTTVCVAAADEALVRSALASAPVNVESAEDMLPGEVRIGGDWSTATATRSSIATTLREAIATALDDEINGGTA